MLAAIQMEPSKYYFFYLEIALKDPQDQHIYAFENVSHVPTEKLIEIFEIDIVKDPSITEGYFLSKKNFAKHKEYIRKNIGSINLDLFEYCLRLYASNDQAELRKMYKENYME
jgi:hypothetical protein